jgi:hypothetical protein
MQIALFVYLKSIKNATCRDRRGVEGDTVTGYGLPYRVFEKSPPCETGVALYLNRRLLYYFRGRSKNRGCLRFKCSSVHNRSQWTGFQSTN